MLGLGGISEVTPPEAGSQHLIPQTPLAAPSHVACFPVQPGGSSSHLQDTHCHFWQIQAKPGWPDVTLTSAPWTFHPVAPSRPAIWGYREPLLTQLPVRFKMPLTSLGVSVFPAKNPSLLTCFCSSPAFCDTCPQAPRCSGLSSPLGAPFIILMYPFKSGHVTNTVPF